MFQDFNKNSDLKKFYNVLSTNVDEKGKEFISTFEGIYLYVTTEVEIIASLCSDVQDKNTRIVYRPYKGISNHASSPGKK
jgi:hypothetical protein